MSVANLGGLLTADVSQLPSGARFHAEKEAQQDNKITQLAAHIRTCWRVNRDHRVNSGIERVMLECTRQRNGEYDADDKAKIKSVDIFMNITGLKCRAAESWLKDVLVNAADQPWTIGPTPIPELSADLKEQVVVMLKNEILSRGLLNQAAVLADQENIKERVKSLKNTSMREMQQLAQNACDRMSLKIKDQMSECDWRTVFEHWQSDIITYPSGVMKGPIIRNRKSLKWEGNQLVVGNEATLVSERVSPLDLYPSPESTTPQNANSIIERMRMTKSALYDCIGLPNFSEDAIRMVIAEFEDGFHDWLSSDSERASGEKKSGTSWNENQTIDVIDFWGKVQGSMLIEWGIQSDDQAPIDSERQYECNAWLIDNYCIRALLNPDPLGRRPYRVTSFNKLPGQFWGEGIPQLLREVQRTANAAVRNLIRNMAFASGPVVEMDIDRLDESEDRPEEIQPWKVYYTKPSLASGGGGAAIRYVLAPSVVNELIGIFDKFYQLADDFSGIPAYTYGNTNAHGAGGTMGGLTLMYGNALKGIKNVIQNMDRDGIEPMIQQYWAYNMLYDPDQSIKADAKVIAKGSEGILQKETAAARSIETLQVISPFIQNGMIPQKGAEEVIKQWLGENGYDIDQFFPDATVDNEINGAFGVNQTSMQPGTQAPPLDGRQGAAIQAMQASQLPGQ